MTLRKVLLVLLAIPLCIYIGWRVKYPAFDWQQTLTFYITTPDGPIVASNTGHARWREGPRIFVDAGSGSWSYDGEALVADLGGGQYLFGLLGNNLSLGRLVGQHNGKFDRSINHNERSRLIARSRGEAWEVPFDLLPPLITFDDVTDMETLSFVDPENIANALGVGYSLDRVTFEITNTPTTIGQMDQRRLDWFVEPDRGYYDFPVDSELGVIRINGSNFWRGDAALSFLERQ